MLIKWERRRFLDRKETEALFVTVFMHLQGDAHGLELAS